ncbi:MAG: glycoside hydrolase family 127 protein [Bacteroidales bacterium]|nr:glycoside hydrolase family 127 protein [Bacteroidales bacterium]
MNHLKNKKIFIICAINTLILGSIPLNAQNKIYPNEFPLEDVKLLDGPFKHARDLNIEVLLKYDVDRLLAPYRKEAGLPKKAECYPNWAGLDGHVGGHYLSAMAMNFAATRNKECKKRMEYMLSELKECQEANAINNPEWGTGYVGGFPNSAQLWSAFKKDDLNIYKSSWAPFYNLHKIYAGLRDAWLYCDYEDAKEIFLKFCDWGIYITSGLTDEQMQEMLDVEHGGMNEVYIDAYQITGNEKYLEAARRFSHRALLDPLSEGIDNLDNKHANTQIPKFVGFERIAELSKEEKYDKSGRFFWETVTKNRSLAFGGNSRREHFPSEASCIDFVNLVDGPESCNSYNMLKLSENLFRMHPLAKYVDYYERTLLNHILSTQHPEHGGFVYFTTARPRHYRVYSAPNMAMWCCVGTGMENHSKYNQFIYTHSKDTLYLNLFIASELNWKEKGVKIKQETNFPCEEQTKLTLTEGSSSFNLKVRYPGWVDKGALKIIVNDKEISCTNQPSSYVSINRKWKEGDVIQILLPMHNTIEQMPNVPEYIAFMHGPVLLGAKTGTEDLKGIIADDGRWSQYPIGKFLPIDKAPILIEDDIQNIAGKLEPVNDKPLNFKLNVKMVNPIDLTLEPFYQIHDSRYIMYWLTLTNREYKAYIDSLKIIENEKLALEKRTIDLIATGEQQPETDHAMEKENSETGNNVNEFWRDARNNGYFSYEMSTNSETGLSLFVRYWGAEWGGRKFDIFIDDEKLLTEDNTGVWNVSKFKDIIYPIPDSMVKGKSHIRVKFQALPGNTAGPVYIVRLLRSETNK